MTHLLPQQHEKCTVIASCALSLELCIQCKAHLSLEAWSNRMSSANTESRAVVYNWILCCLNAQKCLDIVKCQCILTPARFAHSMASCGALQSRLELEICCVSDTCGSSAKLLV